MSRSWRERHGGTRQYYHFIYKNVLFLMISTEDPPKDPEKLIATDPEQAKINEEAYKAIHHAVAAGEAPVKILELLKPIEEWVGGINISDAQVEYFEQVLQVGAELSEMSRHGLDSFCCGAGGAQMWKEEERGAEWVNANRFREADATGASTLAVGCPFCMVMLTDAGKDADSEMQVLDVAEIVAQWIDTE